MLNIIIFKFNDEGMYCVIILFNFFKLGVIVEFGGFGLIVKLLICVI